MSRTESAQELRKAAKAIFNAGIGAVAPEACIDKYIQVTGDMLKLGTTQIPFENIQRIFLIGAGKASAAMAARAEALLGSRVHDGLVITKYGHGANLEQCRVMEAGHPVPDRNGQDAADALLDLVSGAGPKDLILCMISGGASALTPAPAEGITLEDKQETTRQLLGCGANIHEINTVRKHLSRIKGGQLCRKANGAPIISLILSDVIGDDLDIIGSGMTAPDRGTFKDCRDILVKYGLWDQIPKPVQNRIHAGIEGQIRETPKPGSPEFANVTNLIVGSLSDALSAAEKEAANQGFAPLVLSSMIQGEASEVARVLCAVAKEVRRSNRPVSTPACLLSGGETTVTIRGEGKGGRNMELALAAGMELAGESGILMLSAGTDGTDGPTDAAGAFADGSTTARAEVLGLSAPSFLGENDSYHFFKPLDDLLITGPTRTNVMDLQILLVNTR
ncbi:glycerate kinase type-2 family protein [Desulfospira joergensenii]|uniref:glycerate kinase type-2 family protein n=1 Tax=Desulfospira joergensenii TaxID=53329 RepID=UPI0003B52379|nr:glycerate kinase [Desulfospira joergensenii]